MYQSRAGSIATGITTAQPAPTQAKGRSASEVGSEERAARGDPQSGYATFDADTWRHNGSIPLAAAFVVDAIQGVDNGSELSPKLHLRWHQLHIPLANVATLLYMLLPFVQMPPWWEVESRVTGHPPVEPIWDEAHHEYVGMGLPRLGRGTYTTLELLCLSVIGWQLAVAVRVCGWSHVWASRWRLWASGRGVGVVGGGSLRGAERPAEGAYYTQ